jgi:hypothetical protein
MTLAAAMVGVYFLTSFRLANCGSMPATYETNKTTNLYPTTYLGQKWSDGDFSIVSPPRMHSRKASAM